MRVLLCTFIMFLLLGAGYAAIPEMPNIVAQFDETRGLWNSLYRMGHLPTTFVTGELRGLQVDRWHSFLREHGARIIDEEWNAVPKKNREVGMGPTIRAMTHLARNPTSRYMVTVADGETQGVAARLIVRYAMQKLEHDHVPAVKAYMDLPDDQMLVYPNNQPSWD